MQLGALECSGLISGVDWSITILRYLPNLNTFQLCLSTISLSEFVQLLRYLTRKKYPQRLHVACLWQNSSLFYNTILSMAAACLSNQLPHLSAANIAVPTRRKASQGVKLEARDPQVPSDLGRLEGALFGMPSSRI